jgi:hypothetical protein
VDAWDQFRAKALVVFSDSVVEFVSSYPERFDDGSQLGELYSSLCRGKFATLYLFVDATSG